MAEEKPPVGSVTWFDLTVENAEELRDFYREVVGWESSEVPMGDYADFAMTSPDSGDPMAGICHARGSNAHLPPVWMIYVNVADIEHSVRMAKERGGELLGDIRTMPGHGRYCALRDPAGAVLSLFEPA